MSKSANDNELELFRFLNSADESRQSVYDALNNLSDIRYIYMQRMLYAVSGENDRQSGFFMAVFALLFSSVLIVTVFEYFFLKKPFKDIMLFLRDLRDGKRGQRLYFSSLVKEIKESEDSINAFVKKAEDEEAHHAEREHAE